MSEGKIDVSDDGVRILDVLVPRRDVAEYIRALPEDEREAAVIHAVEVGVFCLERARAGQSLDFVRREIDSLLSGVQKAVERMPGETQKQLTAKIGTKDGQVLAPVRSLVENVSKVASDKVEGIRK